ncbi:MAG: L-rhamnose mutarotase, partial [Muribaculaceae bacterium]|nr:L-rhamnose mutarotase [Muribaculaceae bacterium]
DRDAAMARLATLPRQAEWEEFVGQFQQCEPGSTSAGKWREMTRIFSL